MKKYIPGMARFAAIVFGMWLATFALVTVTRAKFEELKVEKAQMESVKLVTADDRARQLLSLIHI